MRHAALWLLAYSLAGAPSAAQLVPAQIDSTQLVPASTEPPPAVWLTEAAFLEPARLEPARLESARLDPALGLDEALRLRRAERVAVGRFDEPTLSVSREAVDVERETEVSVGWRPPRPDRRRLALAAADARVDAAEASYRGQLLALRLELKAVFAEWAIATARVEPLETEARRFERLARRAQARADAGETSGWEARRLRLAASEATARAALTRVDAVRAEARARAWRPDLAAGVEPLVPGLDRSPLDEAPRDEETPEILALRAELAAAQLEVRLASKVARLPEIAAGWKRVDETRALDDIAVSGGETSSDGLTFGLSWSVPVARRGERLAAAARRDGLAARLARLEASQAAELAGLRAARRDLQSGLVAAQAVLADIEPSLRAATVAFDLGERDLDALVETIQAATTAHLTHLDLRHRLLALDRELERLRASKEGISP